MKKAGWERVDVDKVEVEKMSDKVSRQMFNGEHTTVARISVVKGTTVPRHAHPSEQYTLLLSGLIKMVFDNGEVVLRPGEMVFIKSHVPHIVEALEAYVSLDFFGPRREDWISKDDAYLRA
jgi:quercetin dioxygenase-like cupin family protein